MERPLEAWVLLAVLHPCASHGTFLGSTSLSLQMRIWTLFSLSPVLLHLCVRFLPVIRISEAASSTQMDSAFKQWQDTLRGKTLSSGLARWRFVTGAMDQNK